MPVRLARDADDGDGVRCGAVEADELLWAVAAGDAVDRVLCLRGGAEDEEPEDRESGASEAVHGGGPLKGERRIDKALAESNSQAG